MGRQSFVSSAYTVYDAAKLIFISTRCWHFDYEKYSVKIGGFPLSSELTTYVCKGVTFPKEAAWHVTGFEPIIDVTRVVHHILVFKCVDQMPEEWFECNPMPSNCQNTVAVWAVGGNSFEHPPEAGEKIGRGTDALFGAIQMHYDNFYHEEGIVDK